MSALFSLKLKFFRQCTPGKRYIKFTRGAAAGRGAARLYPMKKIFELEVDALEPLVQGSHGFSSLDKNALRLVHEPLSVNSM